MRGWSWEHITKELEKCVLLCKNCHAAVHAGLLKI
jgi:predicted HNH restriction endonuclease